MEGWRAEAGEEKVNIEVLKYFFSRKLSLFEQSELLLFSSQFLFPSASRPIPPSTVDNCSMGLCPVPHPQHPQPAPELISSCFISLYKIFRILFVIWLVRLYASVTVWQCDSVPVWQCDMGQCCVVPSVRERERPELCRAGLSYSGITDQGSVVRQTRTGHHCSTRVGRTPGHHQDTTRTLSARSHQTSGWQQHPPPPLWRPPGLPGLLHLAACWEMINRDCLLATTAQP